MISRGDGSEIALRSNLWQDRPEEKEVSHDPEYLEVLSKATAGRLLYPDELDDVPEKLLGDRTLAR